jgi:hypothetical protein
MHMFPNLFLHQEGHGKPLTGPRYKQSSALVSRCAVPSMVRAVVRLAHHLGQRAALHAAAKQVDCLLNGGEVGGGGPFHRFLEALFVYYNGGWGVHPAGVKVVKPPLPHYCLKHFRSEACSNL